MNDAVINKIKVIISEGHLDGAIEVLNNNNNDKNTKELINDFYQLKKKHLMQDIAYHEISKERKELVTKLINILNKYVKKREFTEGLNNEEINLLIRMIGKADLETLFQFLINDLGEKLPDSVKDRIVKLSFEYYTLQTDYHILRIIEYEIAILYNNRISKTTLDLVNSLINVDFFRYYNENPLVFVVIAFHESMNPVYEVVKGIGKKYNLNPVRVKDVLGDYKITDKIIDLIKKAKFVVADLSLERPNVYFELGYARGLGKTVITICDMNTTIHFDVKDWTCLYYKDSEDLAKNLDERFRIELENG